MPRNVTSVKTPGQASPLPATEQESNAPAIEVTQIPTDPVALAALIQAEVSKALRAQARAKLVETGAAAAADLPDQKDIDASKLDRAVLTKQGYVVPPSLGERPAHLKNLI